MKKLFVLFGIAALLAACSDDDEPGNGTYEYAVEWPDEAFIPFGESAEYEVTRSGYTDLSYSAPLGWTVTEKSGKLTVTAPGADDPETESWGAVTVSGDVAGNNFSVQLPVYSGIVVGFEDVPQEILAVDPYGSNFYSDYGSGQYTEYTDPESGLYFSVNSVPDYYTGEPTIEFWNGGTFFSIWNEQIHQNVTEYLDNYQCVGSYVDPATGKGGHGGSEVFAVVFYSDFAGPTVAEFTGGESYVIDHIWVTNTFYTSHVITYGNEFGETLAEIDGEYYLTVTGFDVFGKETGTVEFHLADFRTADSPGLLTEWAKVDLTPLGEVNRIEFTLDGSDQGPYGLNTPAYFCFDDIAIRIQN
ncbi:MAG: DUF4465 domain-containing protein [Rikenellaceae bacterium]|nr:DUF4465 domain-containing protein [Rikenellaceae bacterium]